MDENEDRVQEITNRLAELRTLALKAIMNGDREYARVTVESVLKEVEDISAEREDIVTARNAAVVVNALGGFK